MSLWLVTGGSGFLGRRLLRRLAADGIAARSLDLVPLDEAIPGIDPIVGDVRSAAVVERALSDVDVVVHAAAALPSTGGLDEVNAAATASLARAAATAGATRCVLVSSAVVYGIQPAPVSETAEPRPVEPYGRSKLEGEQAWLASAPSPVVLRPTAFIGPERLGAFGLLFRWIAEGRRLWLPGGGSNTYQLLDVDDLGDAIVRAGADHVGGAVNVGGRVSGTVREDLEALIEHAASESTIHAVPVPLFRGGLATLEALRLSPLGAWHRLSAHRDIVFDCTRADQVLGWRPRRGGAEALVRAYDWYVAEGRGRPAGSAHRTHWRERGLGVLRRLS
jgi:nucleoside-diphosphate-sugar epimerase